MHEISPKFIRGASTTDDRNVSNSLVVRTLSGYALGVVDTITGGPMVIRNASGSYVNCVATGLSAKGKLTLKDHVP